MGGFVIAQVYQCWMLPRSSFLYHSTCHRSFIYLRTDQRYVLSQFNMSLFHLCFWCLVFFVPLNFLSLSTVWKHSTVKCGRSEITIFKKNNLDICWILLEFQICYRPLPLAIAEYWIRIYYKANGKLIKYIVFFFSYQELSNVYVP